MPPSPVLQPDESNPHAMETIHESGQPRPKMAAMFQPGVRDEAALFSVVKSNQFNGDRPKAPERSASLNMPATRKPSRVREWVKRSNSSGTGSATPQSPSESLKSQIKHLGGGRLIEDVVERKPNNTNLAVPGAKRAQRSRASSIDSRKTQWLDFYENQPPPAPLPLNRPRGSDADLRPLPLRVPSNERVPPSKPLVRKNSKWKPLPTLPGVAKQPEPGIAAVQIEQTSRKNGPESNKITTSQGQDDVGFLPIIQFGTPPPTPDSSTEGSVRVRNVKSVDKYPDDTISRQKQPRKQAQTHDSVRHTRHERIWLHVNYRGEAPFLQAWGLKIAELADRLEGLSILRDLMQADEERNRATRDDGNRGLKEAAEIKGMF